MWRDGVGKGFEATPQRRPLGVKDGAAEEQIDHDLDVVGAKIKHGGGRFAGKSAAWCEAKMKNMRLYGTDLFITHS